MCEEPTPGEAAQYDHDENDEYHMGKAFFVRFDEADHGYGPYIHENYDPRVCCFTTAAFLEVGTLEVI